jgi:hypothetical protein
MCASLFSISVPDIVPLALNGRISVHRPQGTYCHIASIFNLDARYTVVSVTPRPLYPRNKRQYCLYRTLRRLLGRSGRVWGRENILLLAGFEHRSVKVASRYTD